MRSGSLPLKGCKRSLTRPLFLQCADLLFVWIAIDTQLFAARHRCRAVAAHGFLDLALVGIGLFSIPKSTLPQNGVSTAFGYPLLDAARWAHPTSCAVWKFWSRFKEGRVDLIFYLLVGINSRNTHVTLRN